MRILIITSCTGEKVHAPDNQLTHEDFRKGPKHVHVRERQLKAMLMPASEMYTGEQHARLMQGVAAVRERGVECRVKILSAGYGFIPEDRIVAPYECTFSTMKTQELKDWATHLKSPEGFRSAVSAPYDFALILLGDNYLKACALDAGVKLGGMTLLFAGQGPAKKLPRIPNLRVGTLSNAEAKRFSCGLVGLKGELAARLLKLIAADPGLVQRLKDPATDVLALLDSDTGVAPKPSGRSAARANSKVDLVINIPQSWYDKPHRNKLRYFIPEWDDLVDPDYDFINDQHSGGSGDWSNQVYAHQMYPEPNYDGLLMSRSVAEKSKKKKERINALGVHRFLRVPREFPIMGDCGAFVYIMEKTPPYTTADVLDYYTRLDFDYGVSVDHLIVTATEKQKNFRYELTIHNADEFLKEHRKAGLKWEPIGAVQGWDPESYAKAASQYVKMGYRYIGLGGLVRSSTKDILRILDSVHAVVPKTVGMHLFGLARLKAISAMANLGVTSVDSASALRQAWFGANDNYWSEDGQHFRAIRVPHAGKSFRSKRMVQDGRASLEFVEEAERQCMLILRQFDKGDATVDQVIATLTELDHLITPDRPTFMKQYRRTLECAPWKKCPCAICKKDGIETIIFRGNDRNRRRGFHNTYVFYHFLQDLLSGQPTTLSQFRTKNDDNQLTMDFPLNEYD